MRTPFVLGFLLPLVAIIGVSAWVGAGGADGVMQSFPLRVSIDAKTGCHYLSSASSGGGVTPRLLPDGRHWCDEVESR